MVFVSELAERYHLPNRSLIIENQHIDLTLNDVERFHLAGVLVRPDVRVAVQADEHFVQRFRRVAVGQVASALRGLPLARRPNPATSGLAI